MKKIFFLTLITFMLSSADVFAGKRYWIAGSAAYWNNPANWSASSGGAGGAGVPGLSDTAYFDGNGQGNDTLDANISVKWLNIGAGYTGRIVQRTYTITLGTTGAVLSGGTFSGGSASITSSGAVTISGCAFTSTSGTFSTNSNFTLSSGSFTHNNGTAKFTASNTIAGTIAFYHLTFSPSSPSSYSISNTITANGTLTIEGSARVTLDNGTVQANGNITITNSSTSTSSGGTGTILIGGSSSQTFTGSGTTGAGKLPHVTVNKSGGTLNLVSNIAVNGNWTYVAGTVAPGTSIVEFYGNYNLDGQGTSTTMSFNRVQIYTSTRTLTGNLDVNENFAIASGATCVGGSYTIYVGGNWNSQGTWTCGTSTVVFDGAEHNNIRGAAGTIQFANVTVNRNYTSTPKSVRLLNPVQINTSLTLVKGRVIATSANYLVLVDNATCTVTNDDSAYVHGPVRKTGNDAFTFPLGDTTVHDSIAYHPVTMTAPGVATDQFEAQYFASGQAYGTAKASTLQTISACEYWTFNRLAGTSVPTVTLRWNWNCDNGSYSEMRVALWNGTQWTDLGQNSFSITDPQTGTITASSATSFTTNPAPITIAYTTVNKSYAALAQTLDGGYTNTDGNVLYFQYEEEYKDANGTVSFQIINVANNTPVSLYGFPSAVNIPVKYGTNYFKMDLYTAANTPLASGMYVLIVTNDKNESQQLMFNKN